MNSLHRPFLRFIATLTLVVLFYSITLTKGRAAGQAGLQQPQDFNVAVTCPDVKLQAINQIDFTKILALQKNGILGLPCDSGFASDGTDLTTNLQHGFDYYSWLTFLALNSPASGAAIGAGAPDAPTVWETYKQLPDVMLPKGKPPVDWVESSANPLVGVNNQIVPEGCPDPKGRMIIHMDMEETYNEPFKSGPLFDQNGNYALFVILLNEPMFEYINHRRLFNVEGQEAFDSEISFPNGTLKPDENKKGRVGAIMIKASWKLMKEGTDFGKNVTPKYHMIDGLLYRPKAPEICRPVKLGLVGFHVGHKTDTRQQWIWTTFEHHDNVPTESEEKNGIPSGTTFSFYNPGCKASDCPVNQTPAGSWEPDVIGWSPFPENPKFRSQIVRTGRSPVFPDDDVGRLNKMFQAAPQIKNTVWKNYDLITTQWPSGHCAVDAHPENLPDATCAPFPTFLANSTLETFSQPQQQTEMRGDPDAGVPLATSSCISCHNNATTQHRPASRSDFTYILEKAKSSKLN
jgi:hypothetical protein